MSITTITYTTTPPPGSTADVDDRLVALCDPASFVGVVAVDGGGYAVKVNPSTWAGLVRTDTGALVASVGSALVGGVATAIAPTFTPSTAAYVYTYNVTDPAPGLTYGGWAFWSVGGIGAWLEFSKDAQGGSASGPTPASMYATLEDLQNEYGAGSVADWSDTSGQNVQDNARIQLRFSLADAEIIRTFLPNNNFAMPLQPLGQDIYSVKRWVLILTGQGLYDVRSQGSDDPITIKMAADVARVRREMAYAAQTGFLNAVKIQSGPTTPMAIQGARLVPIWTDFRRSWF